MQSPILRAILMGVVVIAGGHSLGIASAFGQAAGRGGSLGGYGGMGEMSASGTGMSGPAIPYSGMSGGFMPTRMGGGSNLGFRPRSMTPSGVRSSFSLSSMSEGMSAGPTGMGMGQASGSRGRMGGSFSGSSGGMRLGSGSRPMGGSGGMGGVMPPSIGYPFRQPQSLVPSSGSGGAGMSM